MAMVLQMASTLEIGIPTRVFFISVIQENGTEGGGRTPCTPHITTTVHVYIVRKRTASSSPLEKDKKDENGKRGSLTLYICM